MVFPHLYDFVVEGGTLVTLDSAVELPIVNFGLPVRDVTSGQRDTNFYVPGALLDLEIDQTHPIGYGLPSKVAAVFTRAWPSR